ncbi:unnamed protein product [Fusarium graminearum]|nr:unnamed protein product [Fusarium graminearum]
MHAVGTQARGYGEKLPAEQCTISSLARYSVSTIGRVDAASRCPCRNETASHRIASHRRGQQPTDLPTDPPELYYTTLYRVHTVRIHIRENKANC